MVGGVLRFFFGLLFVFHSEEDAYGDEITHYLPLHPKEPPQ